MTENETFANCHQPDVGKGVTGKIEIERITKNSNSRMKGGTGRKRERH